MSPPSTVLLPQQLIRDKRDGKPLGAEQIRGFIAGVTDGSIPDYQAAAMLMAVYFRSLDAAELGAWADAMTRSGDVIDLSSIKTPKIDKHSTGGVGDKISLPLAPAVAACGVAVPMVSGRGLGHTGGTLDKLESIPGFRVDLTVDKFRAQVDRIGCALIGQTDRIAPADRKLYALRDVTATVESIPLIAASIMSKKLAAGIDGMVLDCKVGTGAFMKTIDRARELGRTIQTIGHQAGKPVTVCLTAMDQPIGAAVGNALEIEETIEVLRGGGPADTRALTVALGAEMLRLAGITDGASRIERALASGAALDKFRQVVEAQGGDPRVCDDPAAVLPRAPHRCDILTERRGWITAIDAEKFGVATVLLGGGRRRKEDEIDPAVGFTFQHKVGDQVAYLEEHACTIHYRDEGAMRAAAELLRDAITVGDAPPASPKLVLEVLRPNE
jgi:pyrimidine-nucleoside phosphorylase